MNTTPQTNPISDRPAKLLHLSDLDLDARNPRFGGITSGGAAQETVLDHIVENFTVEDVISSLAVNGYFRAEPLVGRKIEGTERYVIVEGNRRLAACLILSDDPRAAKHKTLGNQMRKLWDEHGRPSIDPVPVICFDQKDSAKELLSYLGVRHISASSPWDSYAKAAWINEVVEASSLTVAEVARMVGDKHKTVARLLEGFYVVHQAEDAGEFRPADSQRSGRGSVTAYPFSWVYTLLGYQTVRSFLALPDGDPKPNPVPPDHLPRVGLMMRAMFGDRKRGLSSAVGDSRDLGDLASVFGSSEKVALLEQGRSISEIRRITQPVDDRLRYALGQIRTIQQELLSGLSEQALAVETAAKHLPAAATNRRSAQAIEKALSDVVNPLDD